ncbi:MAG: phage terminase small subunit P27 family [Chloroflexota bacterium]
MAGRPPKPSNVTKLHGNPSKRKLNDAEPKPKVKIPSAPKILQGEARKEWRRISKELHALGLLTDIDRAALTMYCQAWGRWMQAEEALAETFENDDGEIRLKNPLVATTDRGYEHTSAWLQVSTQAYKQMKQLLTEFGMTPSARSRIRVEMPKEEDDYEQFRRRKAGS